MYAIGNVSIFKIIYNSFLWYTCWWVISDHWTVLCSKKHGWDVFLWMVTASMLAVVLTLVIFADVEPLVVRDLWIALVPGSSSKWCFREPRNRAGKAGVHFKAFPLHVFIRHGMGRKRKHMISVNSQGLKSMWAVAQGCFVGPELCAQAEEMEMLVAHNFVVEVFSFLCHMQASLWRWPTNIFRYERAPTHKCIWMQTCTVMHTHRETSGRNRTDCLL